MNKMKQTEVKTTYLLLTFCLTLLCLVDSAPHNQRFHDCDSGNPADVIFILDASNSIWRPDFQRQIGFVKDISRMFVIGPNNTQIAVITYADYPQFQFHLNYYSTKSDILAAIDNVRQMGGYHTSTPDALRYMRERGFSADSGGRGANVTRVGIVITDGRSDDPVKTAAEAKRAKDAGIHLFSVGVGLELDLQELEDIASIPSKYYTFMVESYSGLENIKDLLAIKACSVTDPPTTTTTVTTTQSTTTTTTTTTKRNEEDNHHQRKTSEKEGLENIRRINFATGPQTTDFDSDYHLMEYDETSQQWKRKIRKWNDVRQNGHWDHDKDGKRIWIEGSKKIPGSGREEEEEAKDERGNKTQEANGFVISPDYQVLPVDESSQPVEQRVRMGTGGGQNGFWGYDKDGQWTWIQESDTPGHGSNPFLPVIPVDGHHNDSNGHSKTNHSKKNRIDRSDSKTSESTASNKISVCRPKTPLDVVFVVDSKSGDRRSHRQMLEAVRHIVEQVDMNDGQMRVQFVHSCSRTDQGIKGRSPIARSLPVEGEARATAPSQTSALFETMTSKLTTNGRPGRKRVGVYLTNGLSGDLERTLEAVQTAKNVHEVEMFAVGLGKEVNPVELRAIASCDVAKHMFTLRHHQHHSKWKELFRHLARSLCSVR